MLNAITHETVAINRSQDQNSEMLENDYEFMMFDLISWLFEKFPKLMIRWYR